MKIFEDKNLTTELENLKLGVVEAGTHKDFIYYILNDGEGELRELEYKINNNEVEIISFPSHLF